MSDKKPQPNFQTPDDQLGTVEQYKLASHGVRGKLHEHLRDLSTDDLIDESEQLAKSHGIYLEYNRATTGKQKDWMYMVRVSVPGGGGFNRDQWRTLDELADRFTTNPEGKPSLRLTTRQNIQFHWIRKASILDLIRGIASTGFYTLNGCGDNARNTMACPLSRFSPYFNGHEWARKVNEYFRLPAEPHIQIFEIDTRLIRTPEQRFEYGPKLLNRKFKMAFSAVHRDERTGQWSHDNCVELRTNDLGVAPIVENDRVVAMQVYIGGGQGEKNGKPTFASHGKPLAIFTPEHLLHGLDAVVKVHQDYGDRQNRHWARLKYVVQAMGIPWYQQQIRQLGAVFEPPRQDFDPGPRMLHHGWQPLPGSSQLAFGCYIENGRLNDAENGNLKTMVRHVMDTYPVQLMTTPNQDLLFVNIPPDAKESLEADLRRFGHGHRHGKAYSTLRVLSGACVGLDTCRLSYTESERFEPELLDELDQMGYGHVAESIGITGCERQCFRPATKTLGWIGQGPDLYGLKLGGSEDGRTQGQWVAVDGRWYLRQVPRDKVATVCAVLFDYYQAGRSSPTEKMGPFVHRVGVEAIVAHLKADPRTAGLMAKTAEAPYRPPVDAQVCGF